MIFQLSTNMEIEIKKTMDTLTNISFENYVHDKEEWENKTPYTYSTFNSRIMHTIDIGEEEPMISSLNSNATYKGRGGKYIFLKKAKL